MAAAIPDVRGVTARAMSITTRNGDGGRTRLYSGEEVAKDAPEVDACGDLDELGSLLGVARLHAARPATGRALLDVQRTLFLVAAEIATSPDHLEILGTRLEQAHVERMDRACAELESVVAMPAGFVIPGGNAAGAYLDHARAVARRCERKVISLSRTRRVTNPDLLAWMNRLSDYLWLLARLEEGEHTLPKDG